MGFKIITEYPWWFSFFCLLAGVAYSFVLYRKEKKFSELSVWIIRAMVIFRFMAVSILAFLLLSPLIKTQTRELEKPILLVAQDNSESLVIGKDSGYYKNEYKKQVENFIEKASDKFDVQFYSFGDKISSEKKFDFSEKQTDISTLINELNNKYANRNVGVFILATDGLYNKGESPIYAAEEFKIPIYTIALGDTSVKKDLILPKVAHNRISYLGNTFPIEILVDAKQYKGKSTQVTVSRGNEKLFSQKIDINSNNFTQKIGVQIEAKQKGLQHYKVSLSQLPNEVTFSNNVQDIFIDVIDGREKVLILAASPHPDINVLKQAIVSNQNYEVEFALADNFTKSVNAYNFVILHQIPSVDNNYAKLMADVNRSNCSALYILGNQSNVSIFNSYSLGINIGGARSKPNEVQAVLNNSFPLFTISEEARNYLKYFPPLLAPYGTYKTSNSCNVLATQQIGAVVSKQPLIVFNEVNDKKVGIILGEGIWRWKLNNYLAHNNQNIFNELINKTVQYLSVKADKSLFRIITKNNYFENEAVQFEAELYNESYELINAAEVNIVITNSANKKYPFTFSKTANAYILNAGNFSSGEYKYEARAKVGEKILTQKGEFTISRLLAESINTTADHQILYNLAHKHGGEMLNSNEWDKLYKLLEKREDIKTVSYSEKKLLDIINLKWVFFLLIALLAAEWIMRKRNGAY